MKSDGVYDFFLVICLIIIGVLLNVCGLLSGGVDDCVGRLVFWGMWIEDLFWWGGVYI